MGCSRLLVVEKEGYGPGYGFSWFWVKVLRRLWQQAIILVEEETPESR